MVFLSFLSSISPIFEGHINKMLIGYYAGGHYKQPDHKTTKQPDNQTTTYRFIIFLPFTI